MVIYSAYRNDKGRLRESSDRKTARIPGLDVEGVKVDEEGIEYRIREENPPEGGFLLWRNSGQERGEYDTICNVIKKMWRFSNGK